MKQRLLQACLALWTLAWVLPGAAQTLPLPSDRIQLRLDTSEADAVLILLHQQSPGQKVEDALWQKLFASEPYIRLKKREAQMHREFSDDDFRRFVLSAKLGAQRPLLERTLETWKKADLSGAAGRALSYLPAQARIRATIYPMIKPQSNSFVFEGNAIFLYLDPEVSRAEFENTVAHELHHIGFASVDTVYEPIVKGAPETVRPVLQWISAFGEGLAVLAAAGSPDVHPMAALKPEERIRWDQDMTGFDSNLRLLDQFLLDILNGGFKDRAVIDHVAFSFFGYRGPWYTVGYKMAATVEKRYGRETLMQCMLDPRQLLLRYNQVAEELNRSGDQHLALWSPQLLATLAGEKK